MSKYKFYNSKRKLGTELLRPMGFEFTFEKKEKQQSGFDYAPTLERLRQLGYRGYDDNCLEINSPIFKYMEDVLDFWKKLVKDIGPGFVTRNDYSTGGGTHIHVGVNKWNESLTHRDMDFRKKFIYLLWSMPWLTYAFQDPSDDYSSEPICQDMRQLRYVKTYNILDCAIRNMKIIKENGGTPYSCSDLNYPSLGNKCTSVKIDEDYDTVELRFFDTVDKVDQLKNYILVANALINIADWDLKFSTMKVPTPKYIPKKHLEQKLISGEFLKQYRDFMTKNVIDFSEDKILTRMSFCKQKMKAKPINNKKINSLSYKYYFGNNRTFDDQRYWN